MTTNAYLAGRKAYYEGFDGSNPFPEYSEERHDWMDGWNDEQFESDERYDYEMSLHEQMEH